MNFALYPIAFYAAVLLIGIGIAVCWSGLRQGWGLPGIVVLLTVLAWYVGDALYNDYETYFWEFGQETLENAWWQVVVFLVIFLTLIKPVHDWINSKLRHHHSFAVRSYESNLVASEVVQHQTDRVFYLLFGVWLIVTLIGLSRVDWNIGALFFPYLAGYSVNPWARGRIGGQFDALISLAIYLHIFLTASFGLIFAVSRNPRTQMLAALCFVLSAPYYVIDRTRNTMLAVLAPAVLAFVMIRMKTGWIGKAVALGVAFSVINFWMLFVMAHRGDVGIAQAVQRGDLLSSAEGATHEGLNMFEELAWVNHLTKLGNYRPNWGARYWAEIVNPIPRGLWPGKPEIGLDYAAARGMAEGTEAENAQEGNVVATISTGLIGQGVVNFGTLFGPAFAALLMVLWTALLARQDLTAEEHPARFLLYALGIILTFNMGRDITFIVTYPFFFGYAFVYYLEKRRPKATGGRRPEGAGRETGASVLQETGVSVSEGETVDQRRDVGAGGTVRSMPTQKPKRIARWMPRRVRAAVLAARSAGEEGTESGAVLRKDGGSVEGSASADANGPGVTSGRPRQLAVPYRNYRRYRGT